MNPIPGTKITDTYRLSEADQKWANEILSIRRSAYEKLSSLEQRVQDCTRLLEGKWTELKWQRNWDEAAIVGYDEKTGELVCMVVDSGPEK